MNKEVDLQDLQYYCDDLTGIHHVYQRISETFPEASLVELKELFLRSIRTLLEREKLKFLGEGWVKIGADDIHMKYMFNDDVESWPKDQMNRFFGLMPLDSSPAAIERIMRLKWPAPDTRPFDYLGGSHDWLWFEKWNFKWM